MNRSRREFLVRGAEWVGAGMVGVTCDAILGHPIKSGWNQIVHLFDAPPTPIDIDNAIDTEKRELIRGLLGESRDVVKLVAGRAHYRYPNSFHPDDRWAADVINRYAYALAQTRYFEPVPRRETMEGSFVCTGGVVSNEQARHFLQYSYIDPSRPALGLVRASNPVIRSPFELILDEQTIRRATKRVSHAAGPGKTVLNWSIKSSDGQFIVPDPDAQTDYLLVWRLPNWIETSSNKFTNVATIFAGTHGIGTAALRLLFDHLELLRRIKNLSEKYEYWQALITVDGLRLGTHPHSIQKRLVATSLQNRIEFGQVFIH